MQQTLNSIKHLLKQNRLAIGYWILPIIVAFCVQLTTFGVNRIVFKNLLENSITAIILICFCLLFNKKLSRFFQFFLFSFFVLTNLFESLYFSVFKANISASSIFILLETNIAEASEFISFYLQPELVMITALFLILLGLFCLRPRFIMVTTNFKFQKITFISGVIIPILLLYNRDYLQFNFAFLTVQSVSEYLHEQELMAEFSIDQKTTSISGFNQIKPIDTATFVLVIGESTTRNRMSLYGYERPTTPYLDSIATDLFIFNNMVTSHAYTIEALKDALTRHSLTQPSDFSIIQLLNAAGFKTFWLSNQRPIGEYESLVTKIALASDVYTTKNTALDGSITPFDAALVDQFQNALDDPAKKKFIVLHPMGTHMRYSDRFPKNFQKFEGKSKANFDHEEAHQRSNDYDNAILYHDYFLKQIHKKIRPLEEPSFMLYFSDHGDEVYDSIDFAGHIDDRPTASMYEIPFFLWANKAYLDYHPLQIEPNRPGVLIDFMHSFSDLLYLEFDDFETTKSIFSEKFQFENRIIGQGFNYDIKFKND